MMDRLSGFSTSSFKLQCLGSDSASANQIVRFELPTNALVDIRKFSFAVKLAVAGTGRVRLSEINNIIERVSVTVGGVDLQSGFNSYNLLTLAVNDEVSVYTVNTGQVHVSGVNSHTREGYSQFLAEYLG